MASTPAGIPPTTIPTAPPAGVPKNTWMPTTAGILSIVAGGANFFIGLFVSAILSFIGRESRMFGLGALGAPLIILGIVAIVGGVFALRRRTWGMALAGAICALMYPLSLLGLLSIIFVAISKQEFK